MTYRADDDHSDGDKGLLFLLYRNVSNLYYIITNTLLFLVLLKQEHLKY